MSREEATAEQASDIRTHPGVKAWLALDSRQRIPERVEVLKGRKRQQTVWRLSGAGPGGSAVIAKRCFRPTATVERQVYERILPQLPVSAPNYYGYVEDDKGAAWLFLEDVGRERITLTDDGQRKLAARWLGKLHTTAVDVVGPNDLPERGIAHYHRLLPVARASSETGLHNPAPGTRQRQAIEAVLRLLDTVEEEWGAIEQFCEAWPRTLVHGDFRRKNVLVRAGRTEMVLYAIDWEFSGWGVVAPDLAASRGSVLEPQVDLGTYVSVVGERWPDFDVATCRAQVAVGAILRRLAAVEWAAQSLVYGSLAKPIGQLEAYVPELTEALGRAPWRRGRHR